MGPNKPIEVIVHHDSVDRDGPSFDIVNTFHQSRGFPVSSLGYFVGYHYWIEKDGTIRQARMECEEGAHCVGQNFCSIGIGLAGNFDVYLPTDAQTLSLGKLLGELCWKYQIDAWHVYPHRKFSPKTCYGSLLADTWAGETYLRTEIQQLTDKLTQLLQSKIQ